MTHQSDAGGHALTMPEFVVLGLVAERPRHGYDVEAAIEARRLRYWTPIAFSSIYHVLNKLERAGLLEDAERKGEWGVQRVYRANRRGLGVLRAHLRRFLADPRHAGHDAELAMMFAGFLGDGALLACLERRARRAEENLKEERRLRRYWRERGSRWTDLIFRHTIVHIEAERAWTRAALDDLRERRQQPKGGPK